MKTYMANAQNVQRKWYVVDATDMQVGRLASQVASVLRGKNKPTFTPHFDAGDYVIVINCEKAVFTGKKLEKKIYSKHTGWIGGLKQVTAGKLMAEKPEQVIYHAVKGMLPKNSLGRTMIKKLRVYTGSEHGHEAQKPETLELIKR